MSAFFQSIVTTAAVLAALYGAFVWFGANWIDNRIKFYFSTLSEDYKFELKAHEQGAKIAEYISIARDLKATDSDELYRRANQLAWELFLWLPPDTYRALGRGLANREEGIQWVNSMIEVRKSLLRDRAGDLGPNDIIFHRPNIGVRTDN